MENLQQHKKATKERKALQPAQQHPVVPTHQRPGRETFLVRSLHEQGIAAPKKAGRRFNMHREEHDGIDFIL